MPEAANQTNSSTTLQLAPPRDLLPEPFWRTYGWAVIASVLLLVAGVLLWVSARRRTKPVSLVPPVVHARRALEALRGREPNEALVIEAAEIMRQFLIAEFSLPAHELTTPELSKTIHEHPTINRETVAAVENFLRRCDAMKFAPQTTPEQTDLVAEALNLVSGVAADRASVKAVSATPPIIASR